MTHLCGTYTRASVTNLALMAAAKAVGWFGVGKCAMPCVVDDTWLLFCSVLDVGKRLLALLRNCGCGEGASGSLGDGTTAAIATLSPTHGAVW